MGNIYDQELEIVSIEIKSKGNKKNGEPWTLYSYKCTTNEGRTRYYKSFKTYTLGEKGTFIVKESDNPLAPDKPYKNIESKKSDAFTSQVTPINPAALTQPVVAQPVPGLKLAIPGVTENPLVVKGREIVSLMLQPEYHDHIKGLVFIGDPSKWFAQFKDFVMQQDGFNSGIVVDGAIIDSMWEDFSSRWKD